MVIVTMKAGQLANRLIHFSHFLVHATTCSYPLIYPYFYDYEDYFPNLRTFIQRSPFIKLHPFLSGKFDVFFQVPLKLMDFFLDKTVSETRHYKVINIRSFDEQNVKYDLNRPEFLNAAKEKVVLANGWGFRDELYHSESKTLLRSLFMPSESILSEVNRIVHRCREKGDYLVGVHIRRGDYKYFQNGKWCFSDQYYADKMAELARLLKRKAGRNPVFLICSNDAIQTDLFQTFDYGYERRRDVVDLYSLAQCDMIMGPPSTFTMWASFYNEVPVITMKQKDQRIFLRQARVFGKV